MTMWTFGSSKRKTLSQAVLAGDIRDVRKMLEQGADPNRYDPDDDALPLEYALNCGPEMVQLLVHHGANVNIPSQRNSATLLAIAEAKGYSEVASILRRAGARLHTGNKEFAMDPRFKLQVEDRIRELVFHKHDELSGETPEKFADRIEGELKIDYPASMPPQSKEETRREIRAIIIRECESPSWRKSE
jgi:ankyrin repeat protein